MTKKEVVAFVQAEIAPLLLARGFVQHATNDYQRVCISGQAQWLGLQIGKVAAGIYRIAVYVGVICPTIQRIVHFDDQQAWNSVTVGGPLHLFHPPFEYYEWELHDKANLTKIGRQIRSKIESFAIPFLEQNSDLTAIKQKLSCNSPDAWYTCDPIARTMILAAIDCNENHTERAIAITENCLALDHPEGVRCKLAKFKLHLIALRDAQNT